MIELNGISRSFEGAAGVQVKALRDISLRIAEGELVCITGPSGSGKTTLMNILGCLDRPSSGAYRIAGREVRTMSADGLAWLRRRLFGFVFQSYNLLGSATARENVELPGLYAGLSRRVRKKRADSFLAQLGLADRAGHLPGELSGGEQQRVAIARSLMNGGRVILADEPTGGLDRENGEQVLQALERLAAAGRTVLIISHNPKIAARASRCIELRNGRVIGDTGRRLTRTRSPEEAIPPARKGQAMLSRVLGVVGAGWNAFRAGLTRGARLRAALLIAAILTAVCWGAVVMSIGEGTYREMIETANTMGLDTIQVMPADWRPAPTGEYGTSSNGPRNFLPLTQADARAIRDQIPNVRDVSPYVMLIPLPARRGSIATPVQVIGFVDLGAKPGRGSMGYSLEAGEFITPSEDENLERVAVLEPDIRERLFPSKIDPLGQEIFIGNIAFRVKGLYQRRHIPGMLFVAGLAAHVPFKTAKAMLTSRNEIDQIYVYVEDADLLFETVNAIRDLGIRRRGGDTLRFGHMGETIQEAKKTRAQLWLVLGATAGCVLVAGNVSVSIIMLMSVRARRREIGIRMALGARQRDIQWQFMSETLATGVIGGLLGIAVALACLPLLAWFEVPFEPAAWFFAVPFACALILSFLAAIAPARRAARLDPAQALAAD